MGPGSTPIDIVVQLKSGEPAMTIAEEVAADPVRCLWFDSATPKNEVFPAAALRRFQATNMNRRGDIR